MANIIEIDDMSLLELEVFTKLTDMQLRNKLEPEKGIFIAEGPIAIGLALDNGFEPISLMMERRHITGPGRELVERCEGIPLYTADDALLGQITGFPMTRGILCAMRRKPLPTVEEVCAGAERIAILENITDVTNIGAIFRSAAGIGIDAVLVTPSCCDPLYRRAVRVSMGTIFQIPWTYIGEKRSDWPKNGMKKLKELGFKTAAMALCDDTIPIDDPRLAREEKLAIILGTEGDGLSSTTIAACDYTVKIEMKHGVDSLNVAAASAVAFWILKKQ